MKKRLLFILVLMLAVLPGFAQEPAGTAEEPEVDVVDYDQWIHGGVNDFLTAVRMMNPSIVATMKEVETLDESAYLVVSTGDEVFTLEAITVGCGGSAEVTSCSYALKRSEWNEMLLSLLDPTPKTEIRLSADGTTLEVWVGESFIGTVNIDRADQ